MKKFVIEDRNGDSVILHPEDEVAYDLITLVMNGFEGSGTLLQDAKGLNPDTLRYYHIKGLIHLQHNIVAISPQAFILAMMLLGMENIEISKKLTVAASRLGEDFEGHISIFNEFINLEKFQEWRKNSIRITPEDFSSQFPVRMESVTTSAIEAESNRKGFWSK